MKEADEAGSAAAPAERLPAAPDSVSGGSAAPVPKIEIGGRDGPDPTRYGDWELRGRCIDF
jgi:hypothetical protein